MVIFSIGIYAKILKVNTKKGNNYELYKRPNNDFEPYQF